MWMKDTYKLKCQRKNCQNKVAKMFLKEMFQNAWKFVIEIITNIELEKMVLEIVE